MQERLKTDPARLLAFYSGCKRKRETLILYRRQRVNRKYQHRFTLPVRLFITWSVAQKRNKALAQAL